MTVKVAAVQVQSRMALVVGLDSKLAKIHHWFFLICKNLGNLSTPKPDNWILILLVLTGATRQVLIYHWFSQLAKTVVLPFLSKSTLGTVSTWINMQTRVEIKRSTRNGSMSYLKLAGKRRMEKQDYKNWSRIFRNKLTILSKVYS